MARAIEATVWKHVSGRTASVCGACPWRGEREKAEWSLVSVGWTIEHNDGTRGIGRPPFASRAEAEEWLKAHPGPRGWSGR